MTWMNHWIAAYIPLHVCLLFCWVVLCSPSRLPSIWNTYNIRRAISHTIDETVRHISSRWIWKSNAIETRPSAALQQLSTCVSSLGRLQKFHFFDLSFSTRQLEPPLVELKESSHVALIKKKNTKTNISFTLMNAEKFYFFHHIERAKSESNEVDGNISTLYLNSPSRASN